MLDALDELLYFEQNAYHAGYSFFVQNVNIQCAKLRSISTYVDSYLATIHREIPLKATFCVTSKHRRFNSSEEI